MPEDLPEIVQKLESLQEEVSVKDSVVTQLTDKRTDLEDRLRVLIEFEKDLKGINYYSKYIESQLFKLDEVLIDLDLKIDLAIDEFDVLSQECEKVRKEVCDAGWRINWNPRSTEKWYNINAQEE